MIMEKFLISIFILLFFFQSVLAFQSFCGWSTYASCSKDSDCQAGGCSGQVCERIGEGTMTTCEFKECYVAENYNLTCQCINNKCQWGYQNKTPYQETISLTSKIKTFVFSLPIPFFFLIFGIILFVASKLVKLIATILIIVGLILFFLSFF